MARFATLKNEELLLTIPKTSIPEFTAPYLAVYTLIYLDSSELHNQSIFRQVTIWDPKIDLYKPARSWTQHHIRYTSDAYNTRIRPLHPRYHDSSTSIVAACSFVFSSSVNVRAETAGESLPGPLV